MTWNAGESASGFAFESDVLEAERLKALRRYNILDTPPEEAFDRLTELAAGLFDVDVAFVAFLDVDRQWFKSSVGLDHTESSLAASFCTHTVDAERLLVVEDATKDERFSESPYVTEDGFRFYAGAPLVTPDGYAIGTVSVMDRDPRGLRREQKKQLEAVAEIAVNQLSLRLKTRQHQKAARRFDAVLDDPNMLSGVLAPDGRLLETNETSLEYIEEDQEDVSGTVFWKTSWWPDRIQDDVRQWVERAARGEYVEYEAELEDADRESYSVEGTIRPVLGDDGEVTSLVVSARDVTVRKQQERERRLFEQVVEQAGESIVVTEADPLDEPGPRIEYVNPAFEAMTGYRREEVVGKTPRILQGPETEESVLHSLREALERGDAWEGETVNYRKDGAPYRIRCSIAPVRGEDETVQHWMAVQRDVTERREIERSLNEQKQRLQRVQERMELTLRHTDSIVYVINLETREVARHGAFEEFFEASRNELPTWDAFAERVVHPDDKEAFLQFYRRLEEGHAPGGELEYRTRPDGGEVRWIHDVVHVETTETDDGPSPRALGLARDVTKQKEREQALRKSEERFRKMFENAAVGIAIIDAEGRIVQSNPALQAMTRYDAEGLRGRQFFALAHPDDVDQNRGRYDELVDGDRDRYQMETRYVRRDGEVFWGRLTASRHTEGQVIAMVEYIDEQKRQEEELREAKAEAERMNQMKSAFLANMSHEIRTPLTSILGFAEAIGDEVEADEGAVSRFADLIQKSGNRLMETLDGVLNLSKLEAGEMGISPQPIDPEMEVEDAAEQFSLQAERAGVELNVDTRCSARARADKGGLQIVLRNLLSNAIKYTPEGGEVSIRVRENTDAVVLEVEDTGIGMDPDRVPELFEPFRQESEGASREYEGTGLGLAVVKQAIEQMNGTIEVETEKEEGTCFVIRLPNAERESTDA